MGRSLRPLDALVLVAVVVGLGVVAGLQASSARVTGPPPPVSVGDALSFVSDDPLVVRGYLVGERLCAAPRCAGGPSLEVRGQVAPTALRTAVLVLGTVHGGRIELISIPAHARAGRL